jgi:murein L,D-transpeptidase YcbB/YkuD
MGSSFATAGAELGDVPGGASIQSIIEGGQPLEFGARTLERQELAAIYEPRHYEPIWTAPRRESFEQALARAVSQGLDPSQYEVEK